MILVELQIVLKDVDVGCFKQTADFADVGRSDLGVSVDTCHRFRKTDQRLKLSHGVAVGCGLLAVGLAQMDVFVFQHHGCVVGELGLDCSTHFDVRLQLFSAEFRIDGVVLKPVEVNDVLGNREVFFVVLLVEDYKEEVESGHDRR